MTLTKFHPKTYEMRTVILVAVMVNVFVRKNVYYELRIFQRTRHLPRLCSTFSAPSFGLDPGGCGADRLGLPVGNQITNAACPPQLRQHCLPKVTLLIFHEYGS